MTLNKAKFVWLTGSMVLVGALIACGDEKAIDDGFGDDTQDGGSSGSSGASSSSGNTADGGGSSGNVALKSGTISLFQTVTEVEGGGDVVNASASASFFEGTAPIGNPDGQCTASEEGACQVTICDFSAETPDAGTPAEDAGAIIHPHAGEITIGATPIKLTPGADGKYDTKSLSEKIWDTADFTVKAAGDTVPAFEKVLKAPAAIALTAPSLAAGTEYERSADLAFTWTGGGEGVVAVTVATSEMDETDETKIKKSTTLICRYPATAGAGTIPAVALGKLSTGMGVVSTSTAIDENVEVDGWNINIVAVPGSGASGVVSFK